MKKAIKKGVGFGLTSGVITTLGLLVGLSAGTGSRFVVLSGILLIAVADALSDAFGIHISEESDKKNSEEHIWRTSIITFFAKFIIALTFVIPVLLFGLQTAVIVSIIWGLLLISLFSYYISKKKGLKSLLVIGEHLFLAVLVIVITYFVGIWIKGWFG